MSKYASASDGGIGCLLVLLTVPLAISAYYTHQTADNWERAVREVEQGSYTVDAGVDLGVDAGLTEVGTLAWYEHEARVHGAVPGPARLSGAWDCHVYASDGRNLDYYVEWLLTTDGTYTCNDYVYGTGPVGIPDAAVGQWALHNGKLRVTVEMFHMEYVTMDFTVRQLVPMGMHLVQDTTGNHYYCSRSEWAYETAPSGFVRHP